MDSQICQFGRQCKKNGCKQLHPGDKGFNYRLTLEKQQNMKPCPKGEYCEIKEQCIYLHPKEVLNICCPNEQCKQEQCYYFHDNQLQFNQQEIGKNISKIVDFAQLTKEQKEEKLQYIKERGNQLYRDQFYNEAIEQYTQAICLKVRESLIFSNRAQCNFKLKRWDQMHLDCLQALEIDPENLRARYLQIIFTLEQLRAQLIEEYQVVLKKAKQDLLLIQTEAQAKNYKPFSDLSHIMSKINQFEALYQYELLNNEKGIFHRKIISLLQRNNKKELIEETNQYFAKNQHNELEEEYPEYLQCVISMAPFEKPILLESGLTYEQASIELHFKQNGRFDPCTRVPIYRPVIVNKHLQMAIEERKQKKPTNIVGRIDQIQFD